MTSKESKPLLAWFTLAIENGASSASGLPRNRPLTSHVALCANNCHWLRGEIVIEPDNIFNLIMSRYAQNTFANFTQNFSPRLQHANALTKWEKPNLASTTCTGTELQTWFRSRRWILAPPTWQAQRAAWSRFHRACLQAFTHDSL